MNKSIKLFASGKRYDVQGLFEGASIKVLKGSRISDITTYANNREELIKKYCMKKGDVLVLLKDVIFKTPTSAANFCTGGSVNGWDFWKDTSRNPLKALVEHNIIRRPRKKTNSQ